MGLDSTQSIEINAFGGIQQDVVQPNSPEGTEGQNVVKPKQPKEETNKRIEVTDDEKIELIEQLAKEENKLNQNELEDLDPLFKDSAKLIVQNQIGSTSVIQRRMKLGYNRAGRLMDQLEWKGIVGPNLGAKAREVLIKTEAELELFIKNGFRHYKIDIQVFKDEYKEEIEKKRKEYNEQKIQQQIQYEKNLIRQELLEKERKRQLRLEVFKESLGMGIISKQTAGEELKCIGERCVNCGGEENLEIMQMALFSKVDANTDSILEILCIKCKQKNQTK